MEGIEKRRHKRKQLRLKAYALDTRDHRVFESRDVSAGGVYFVGNPGLERGSDLWVRVELGVTEEDTEKVYPVDTKVKIVRLTRDDKGRVIGFGAAWEMAMSTGEVMPLKAFLVNILGIGTGYIQVLGPTEHQGRPYFLHTFVPAVEAQRERASAEGAKDTERPAEDGKEPMAAARPSSKGRLRTGIYAVVPIIYEAKGGEYEGTATKVRPHGLRVVTNGPLPEPYQRTTVKFVTPKASNETGDPLSLVGSVVTVREGGEGTERSFEIEFSLGNPPHRLAEYRRLIEILAEQAAQTRGL